MSSRRLTRSIIVGAAAIAVAGGSYGIVSATSTSPAAASSGFASHPGSEAGGSHAGGSDARSGPAAGGAGGTVSSLSASGFTLTTSAGQKVTIKEASSTTYQKETSPASATANPFQRGAPATSKQAGQVPADYTQGSGTIVSGTSAGKATEAALAAYPGGIVDRVVKLSNGDYEVHYIGVSWPHHVFVSQDYKVIGAG